MKQLTAYIFVLILLHCSGAWAKKKSHGPLKHFKESLSDQFLDVSTGAWMMEQIGEDFAYFRDKKISLKKIDDFFARHSEQHLIAKFSICNNRVFVEKKFPDGFVDLRWQVYKRVIETLCQYVRIPNCVFLISCGDSFVSLKEEDVPVLTFAKRKDDARVILIPDFEVFMRGEDLLKEVKDGMAGSPWERKRNQAVWRGSTTGNLIITLENFLTIPRSKAVALSLDYPMWVNARYSQLVQCLEPEEVKATFAPFFGPSMSIAEQLQYKYQLLIDGNSCAYSRAYWQFFSNSLTFKHDSPDIQWYYRGIKPYEHYVPLKNDLSDLIEQLEWANAHDFEAKEIMERARQFALKNLQLEHVHHYFFLVLFEYGRLNTIP